MESIQVSQRIPIFSLITGGHAHPQTLRRPYFILWPPVALRPAATDFIRISFHPLILHPNTVPSAQLSSDVVFLWPFSSHFFVLIRENLLTYIYIYIHIYVYTYIYICVFLVYFFLCGVGGTRKEISQEAPQHIC